MGILQANVLVQLQATVNAWLQANIGVFVGILQANVLVQLQATVNAWLQANIGVFVGIIRAQIEANLFVQLQNSVNVWLQNNINVFINSIYAQLEANLILRLEPSLRIYLDTNPRFRGLPGPRGLPGANGQDGQRGPQGLPGRDGVSDLNFLPRLIWNSNTNRLELRLTINNVTRTSPVTLDMDCDFTELIQYLTDIQEKVTVTAPIKSGQCDAPPEPGEWYGYNPGPTINGNGFGEAFELLSAQIAELHETACKGVQPKVETRDLPPLIECVVDENGEKQITEMALADMQTNLGFLPPWAFGVAREVVAPWAIDQALNWLENSLKEQTKINQEMLCKLEPGQDVAVLIPDPSAVWNTSGNYLLFYWKLKNPQTPEEKRWNHRSQLADPIDALINGGEGTWDTYFAGIEIEMGNQWGSIYSENKARRHPLYRGWFRDIDHAEEKLWQIASLSRIPKRMNDNPKFPVVRNQTTHLQHQGKTKILRKVCVGYKSEGSDRVDIIKAYEPPPETP